ncbi:MAG: hypothetical protein GEU82_09805 [Luteitalea sp.]|nr:hypothetical protein [Luteitalea sp.]
MRIRVPVRLYLIGAAALVAALVASACSREEPSVAPLATPTLTLNHDRAPAGSPIELTYKFVVANGASFGEDYRVFVHVVDTDEETLWFDDHFPSVPTSQWKPGETIEYTRTVFVPVVPYVGEATIQVGLHSMNDQVRVPLDGDEASQQAYRVGRLQLLPQTDNLFTVFKDGWHPAELASQDPPLEWQWTKKEATLAFRNPKKDSVLHLDLDSPQKALHSEQQVQITMGGQIVEEFTLVPEERMLKKVKLPAAQMGEAEMAELQIVVDKTFVPSVATGGASRDPRELGVRVFHAFVDPR